MSRSRCLIALLALSALAACDGEQQPGKADRLASLGDPRNGEVALRQYACLTCHQVPGLVGPDTWVGPSLRHIGSRTYIAGILANTPENMINWLVDPQVVAPDSAMPDMGVTPAHARDIAAFLYRLE